MLIITTKNSSKDFIMPLEILRIKKSNHRRQPFVKLEFYSYGKHSMGDYHFIAPGKICKQTFVFVITLYVKLIAMPAALGSWASLCQFCWPKRGIFSEADLLLQYRVEQEMIFTCGN